MMYDELLTADALAIAIQAERDAVALLRVVCRRLTNRTLRYQYDALLQEEIRHEERLLEFVSQAEFATTAVGTVEPHSRVAANFPSPDMLETCDLDRLLSVFAESEGAVIDLYEDLASRISDGPVRVMLQELSDAEFFHQAKALTDIELMRRHPDFL